MTDSSHSFFRKDIDSFNKEEENSKKSDKKVKKNTNKRVVFGDMDVRTSNAAFSSD